MRRIATDVARARRGKRSRAAGYVALFAGADRAGKRAAVAQLARELDRAVLRIDLSQVVSKFIGETEKNLARLFQAARSRSAILLFDEADALFGKRTTVRDSHDRYANVETSYLLRRLESFAGLVVLATNLEPRLDAASARHVSASLRFRRPARASATRRWRR